MQRECIPEGQSLIFLCLNVVSSIFGEDLLKLRLRPEDAVFLQTVKHWGKKEALFVQHIKQKNTTTGFVISLLWVLLHQRLFTLVRNTSTAVQAEGGKEETQALHVYFKRHKSASATPAACMSLQKKKVVFFSFWFCLFTSTRRHRVNDPRQVCLQV